MGSRPAGLIPSEIKSPPVKHNLRLGNETIWHAANGRDITFVPPRPRTPECHILASHTFLPQGRGDCVGTVVLIRSLCGGVPQPVRGCAPTSVQGPPSRRRATAASCASRPSPERRCLSVDTR